jgi:hypothetical protein
VRDKREKERAKPFVVVAAATNISGEGDVDFKFENPTARERWCGRAERERWRWSKLSGEGERWGRAGVGV